MVLEKQHRQALIETLSEAQKEKYRAEKILERQKDTDLAQAFEIDLFLITKKIGLIKDSLAENEINL